MDAKDLEYAARWTHGTRLPQGPGIKKTRVEGIPFKRWRDEQKSFPKGQVYNPLLSPLPAQTLNDLNQTFRNTIDQESSTSSELALKDAAEVFVVEQAVNEFPSDVRPAVRHALFMIRRIAEQGTLVTLDAHEDLESFYHACSEAALNLSIPALSTIWSTMRNWSGEYAQVAAEELSEWIKLSSAPFHVCRGPLLRLAAICELILKACLEAGGATEIPHEHDFSWLIRHNWELWNIKQDKPRDLEYYTNLMGGLRYASFDCADAHDSLVRLIKSLKILVGKVDGSEPNYHRYLKKVEEFQSPARTYCSPEKHAYIESYRLRFPAGLLEKQLGASNRGRQPTSGGDRSKAALRAKKQPSDTNSGSGSDETSSATPVAPASTNTNSRSKSTVGSVMSI